MSNLACVENAPQQVTEAPQRRRIRQINIEPAMNGFIVHVGCQQLVWPGDMTALCAELIRYEADPAAVEDEYFTKYGQIYC